ncbi:tripartite tricarboxylate transporter TctB family protein [Roseovarius sp. C7]|uniref:tripartite tricarboxylate transporter TctB family protein n=1 Tax=Roseovarius sp. C7 TaxID=3398643 RepID=UPI0039F5ED80
MTDKILQLRLGITALLAAIILLVYGIPNWVSSPSNVPKIVLSPLFWPQVLAWLTGLAGVGLILFSWRDKGVGSEDRDPAAPDSGARGRSGDTPRHAYLRLTLMALLMLVMLWLMPRLGMVWTAMIGFLATAILMQPRLPVSTVVAAIAVPLVLYAFFAHVAGVAIPQGQFVRLP